MRQDEGGAPSIGAALVRLALALMVMYVGLGLALGYWQVVQAQGLTNDPADPLVIAASRNAPRGRILDATGEVLARNVAGPAGTPMRRYSEPALAPILGYKSLLFGTSGLERTYDSQLVGLAQLGPGADFFRKFRPDPYDPSDLVLSVDVRLQQRAMELLGDDRGAIVAIEPTTGRILALASTPTFDPNRLVDPATGREYLDSLRAAPADESRLLNRATQGLFIPGSVFKIVTAIAGLGSGAITPQTTFPTQPAEEKSGFLVQGFRVRDGHHPATGTRPLDLIGATEVSCNIYYAHTGLTVGGPGMLDWAARLGFGRPIPFDLPTAVSQVTGGNGASGGFRDDVELANAGYGQGEVLATPLQMALVAATVANDGVLMKPRLVDELRSEGGSRHALPSETLARVLDPTSAGVIQRAMQQAVEGDLGRAFAGGAKVPGVPTAGKSGSAQLDNSALPHSWFIGFAPVEAPRIAIAVLVERGGFGRQRAVPMAGELMAYYLGLPPASP